MKRLLSYLLLSCIAGILLFFSSPNEAQAQDG